VELKKSRDKRGQIESKNGEVGDTDKIGTVVAHWACGNAGQTPANTFQNHNYKQNYKRKPRS